MGLAHRVIPTLLARGRQLVKGRQFDSWRSVGVATQATRIYQARSVDELCLLDISATPEQHGPDLVLVRELADMCFMPLAVGGGVKTVQDVRALLEAGADKVVIGTALIENPALLPAAASRFGNQAIVASVDYYHGFVAKRCAKILTEIPVKEWCQAQALHGAGEILLTSVEREGTLEGYDIATINKIAQSVDIPVIAHGGCGIYEHMLRAFEAGASAVAAGAMFQFTDQTPKGACEYLAAKGVEVRL